MIEDNSMDITEIKQEIRDIAEQVLVESDINKTKDLIALFNWNMSKKNVARSLKLNDLFDSITDQMVKRVLTKPDQFSNSDLLDYMKTLQSAIDHSGKVFEEMEEPPSIIQNNTQINVNIGESFDRESRQRILDAVRATLEQAQQSVVYEADDLGVTEIVEEQ